MAIIDKPSDYFNIVLYTGNSTDNHIISGVGFQPDFLWIKDRDRTGYNHRLQNSVVGSTKSLQSNRSVAEQTNADAVKSFNSDGFVLGNDASNGSFNGNSNFVSWNWLASNTTASNTDGSITSTVSVNTTSGFSIVSYTGNGTDNATVGHGLSQKPDMVIIKARENTSSWLTWHKDLSGAGYAVFLDATDAQANYNILKNQSSSVLTLSTNSAVNANNQGFISYNFHSVQGFSKFGSYTGNGNSDGTFVYTGFKPAFILIKPTDIVGNWPLWDNKLRPANNVGNNFMYADLSNAQDTSADFDMLSNGFKTRTASNLINGSGNNYIYMAFAENPFVTSTGVPATAR